MNEREYIPDDIAASVGLKAVRVKPERLPTRRERYLELRGRGFPALLAWRVAAYGPVEGQLLAGAAEAVRTLKTAFDEVRVAIEETAKALAESMWRNDRERQFNLLADGEHFERAER